MIDPGAPDAIPPVAPTFESDADLRRRLFADNAARLYGLDANGRTG